MDNQLNSFHPMAEIRRQTKAPDANPSHIKRRLMRELSLTPLLAAMLAACGGGGGSGGGGYLTPSGSGGTQRSYELMRTGTEAAGNNGIAGDDTGGIEPSDAGSPGDTHSSSNSDDAGDTVPPQDNVLPIPNLSMNEPDGDTTPTGPAPGNEPSDAGGGVGSQTANNGQAGTQGGSQAGNQAAPHDDAIEPSNNGGPGGTYSGSNSDDAGDTALPQGNAPPIPDLSMDEPDGDTAPTGPAPGDEPANAGSATGTSPGGPTIVTEFRSVDLIRIDVTDAQKQAIDATTGNDAKLAIIAEELDLRWVNNAHYN